MNKITTLFCAMAILVLFVLLTGCGNSKKETKPEDTADNDAVDADIDNKELPECSPTSETPCKDSSSNLVWSSKSNGTMYWHDAEYYCRHLSEGGFSYWRLPFIDELRTLIRKCQATETGGECRASEECCESRCENDACSGCSLNSTGYYSKLGDNDILWSYSWPTDWSDCGWAVDFSGASVQIDRSYEYYGTRCVRDSSKDDSEEEEEEDEEEQGNRSDGACFKVDGRVWSNRVKMFWSEAVDYCDNLNECGISDWHLPTISELRTLIQNRPKTEPDGKCGVTDNCLSYDDCYDSDSCSAMDFYGDGRFSKLGDTDWFWSSSERSGNPDSVSAWGVDFDSGSLKAYNKDHYSSDGSNVRCLSSGKGKDRNGCASGEYRCLHSQSLRCEENYWTPDKYCEKGCDPLTGKCRGPGECVSGEYRCPHYENELSEYEYYCIDGEWNSNRYCEGGCNPSTGRCQDLCYDLDDYMWSSKVLTENWQEAVDYCENLTECGYLDWHLPTISELRSLISCCPDILGHDGKCGVTDDCLSSGSCMNGCEGCYPGNRESCCKIGECGYESFWSSSTDSDDPDKAWIVYFSSAAGVASYDKTYFGRWIRCVR